MALIKWQLRREWSPFTELMDLHDEINRLFSRSLHTREREEGLWAPSLDAYHEKGEFVVKSDVPGLEKDNIEISVSDNFLTIKGTKKKEEEIKEEDYHFVERVCGKFSRSVQLPMDVDASKIKATLKDGVLEVRLPETEKAKPRKIPIEIK